MSIEPDIGDIGIEVSVFLKMGSLFASLPAGAGGNEGGQHLACREGQVPRDSLRYAVKAIIEADQHNCMHYVLANRGLDFYTSSVASFSLESYWMGPKVPILRGEKCIEQLAGEIVITL